MRLKRVPPFSIYLSFILVKFVTRHICTCLCWLLSRYIHCATGSLHLRVYVGCSPGTFNVRLVHYICLSMLVARSVHSMCDWFTTSACLCWLLSRYIQCATGSLHLPVYVGCLPGTFNVRLVHYICLSMLVARPVHLICDWFPTSACVYVGCSPGTFNVRLHQTIGQPMSL